MFKFGSVVLVFLCLIVAKQNNQSLFDRKISLKKNQLYLIQKINPDIILKSQRPQFSWHYQSVLILIQKSKKQIWVSKSVHFIFILILTCMLLQLYLRLYLIIDFFFLYCDKDQRKNRGKSLVYLKENNIQVDRNQTISLNSEIVRKINEIFLENKVYLSHNLEILKNLWHLFSTYQPISVIFFNYNAVLVHFLYPFAYQTRVSVMLYLPLLYNWQYQRFIIFFMSGLTNQSQGFDDSQSINSSHEQICSDLEDLSFSEEDKEIQMVPEQHMISNSINSKEDLFQVSNGLINFKETNYLCVKGQNSQSFCLNGIDGPGQLKLAEDQYPVVSQFISIFEGNFEIQQSTQNQWMNPEVNVQEVNQKVPQSQDDSKEDQNTQELHLNHSNQNQGRADDSNNAHKKMITTINKAISAKKKKELKLLIKKAKFKNNYLNLKYVKSSRYGFMQYLLLLKHFFGIQFVQDLYFKFSVQLIKFVQEVKKQQDSEAKDYLLNLSEYYTIAFDQFILGQIESATETTYKMDELKFKQETYKKQGVEKVIILKKELESLME